MPWFFVDSSDKKILGFPHWVAFSILGAFCFAVLMATLIGFFWEVSARENDDESC